jgi:hypothetical protein
VYNSFILWPKKNQAQGSAWFGKRVFVPFFLRYLINSNVMQMARRNELVMNLSSSSVPCHNASRLVGAGVFSPKILSQRVEFSLQHNIRPTDEKFFWLPQVLFQVEPDRIVPLFWPWAVLIVKPPLLQLPVANRNPSEPQDSINHSKSNQIMLISIMF